MRKWTLAERERQAEAIRAWKPWERSTGPTTTKGKAIASGNATSHGMRSMAWAVERKRLNEVLHSFKTSRQAVTNEAGFASERATESPVVDE